MNVQHNVYEIKGVLGNSGDAMRFLLLVTDRLGLTPVGFNAYLFPTVGDRGGTGITAQVSFVESYATIDSWPEENYIHLNIVSCKEFDSKKVVDFLKESFGEVKEYLVFKLLWRH